MSDIGTGIGRPVRTPDVGDRRTGWLAAGGVIGAILASSCCVVPLLLLLLGVSGAWIANLTALAPFQPYIATLTLGLIGLALWRVHFRPAATCDAAPYCARSRSSLVTRLALWSGALMTLLAITINWWAPLFY